MMCPTVASWEVEWECGGGSACSLSGPFLLASLPYCMGHRPGGLPIRDARERAGLLPPNRAVLYRCWTQSLYIGSEQIWRGCNKEKKKCQPLNRNLIKENESISNILFTLPSPWVTSSVKSAASHIDLFHAPFPESWRLFSPGLFSLQEGKAHLDVVCDITGGYIPWSLPTL